MLKRIIYELRRLLLILILIILTPIVVLGSLLSNVTDAIVAFLIDEIAVNVDKLIAEKKAQNVR